MKKVLILLAIFSILLLTACSQKEYCSVLDKRFSCEGSMDSSGSQITFTKVPFGKFTIGRLSLEKSSEDETQKTDCSVKTGNIIEKGKSLPLDCKASESGRYIVHMKIYHSEPASYSPVSGETCLKKNQQWQCDSSAFFAVNI